MQMLQHVTLRRAVFFLLSLFFLPLGRDAPLTSASQISKDEKALFRPLFPGLSPCGASSAVPEEVLLVAQSAATCCCCLRATDKRPVQLGHPYAKQRLRLPVPSSTCRFRLFSILVGPFLPPALNVYSEHQFTHTSSPLRIRVSPH